MERIVTLSKEELVDNLWAADPDMERILRSSENLHEARDRLFDHLNELERHYFNIYSDRHFQHLHILEKNNAKQCIRVLKNVIRTENEQLTGSSCLKKMWSLARDEDYSLDAVGEGFLCELVALFRGINGESGMFPLMDDEPVAEASSGVQRSRRLDLYSRAVRKHFERFHHGLEPDIIKKRQAMKEDILRFFEGDKNDWGRYSWHLRHIVRDSETLCSLVKVEEDELEGLLAAQDLGIPFQVTPYYLSLFDSAGRSDLDRGIRAQVLPSTTYCKNVQENRDKGVDMDFMQEKWTSPVEGITRRYPLVLIIKPFESCPQICVYCQRNWEIKKLAKARMTKSKMEDAIRWISENDNITEVLVTGGDPLTLGNPYIDWLMARLAAIDHIDRIRLGTRTPVTLPFRIDRGLIRILKRHHQWGKREICVVTHFEHASELTPDSLAAIQRLREAGMNVYNQQVFTYYNSRRFETAFLRKTLKVCGVNPYYQFITKGKEETVDFRVPIARIQQEVAEEARLLPGVVRSDEPVFNVPRLGKSYLRAWQDHEPIMILPDGRRVYRFYPWEARVGVTDDYVYTDVSIYDYLIRLRDDGEDIQEYQSIWFYF
jgi:lysine 2,3-aminomutase